MTYHHPEKLIVALMRARKQTREQVISYIAKLDNHATDYARELDVKRDNVLMRKHVKFYGNDKHRKYGQIQQTKKRNGGVK